MKLTKLLQRASNAAVLQLQINQISTATNYRPRNLIAMRNEFEEGTIMTKSENKRGLKRLFFPLLDIKLIRLH